MGKYKGDYKDYLDVLNYCINDIDKLIDNNKYIHEDY